MVLYEAGKFLEARVAQVAFKFGNKKNQYYNAIMVPIDSNDGVDPERTVDTATAKRCRIYTRTDKFPEYNYENQKAQFPSCL